MKPKVLLTLIFLILTLGNLCFGQMTDFNFLGGGARARAMGGAFFGVSDDASAGSWNPAGLSQLDLPQMNFTYYSGRVKVGHKFVDVSTEMQTSNHLILSGAVVIPFKVSGYQLVGSASYERLSVFSYQDYYYFIENWDRSEEKDGNVDAVTLSLGRELLKGFSLGMALNIYTGGNTYKAFQTIPFTEITGNDTTFVDHYYHPLVKGGYSGVNMNFGGMFKIQNFSFGAVVKTPFDLKEKVDAKMEYDRIVGDYVNPGTNRPEGIYYFSKDKWKIPLVWGIGSAFRVEGLTIAADVEYRDFSKAELSYQRHPFVFDPEETYYPTDNSPTRTVNLGWEKGTQFRVGGEYVIATKFGKIPLRAGYRNDPKTFTSVENMVLAMDDTMGDVRQFDTGKKGNSVKGSVISFGTGIGWKQVMFDITYEYSKYDYTLSGVTGFLYYDKDEDQFAVTGLLPFEDKITNKDHRIMANFTGYF